MGLPLGFGFLGFSYLMAALAHTTTFVVNDLAWFQLLARPFAFAFLTFTYYFSSKPSNTRLVWDITLSVLIVALTSAAVLVFVAPQLAFGNYRALSIYIRIFNMFCLLYISIHTLRSHLETRDPKTILTPFGFIFLLVSQYSILISTVEGSDIAFYGGLVLRWIGLVLFLIIAYRTFYGKPKRSIE
ncbi:MAG: hypothetical protein NWE92_06230 [Candidatus Bathyarchaeota archaeon]|nr:hypothetical protein [Candidatus Bathyarchaeota archaeon]